MSPETQRGRQPETRAAEAQRGNAQRAEDRTETQRGPGVLRRMAEVGKKLLSPISWIAGHTKKRVGAVLGSAWDATLGQPLAEAGIAAKRMGFRPKETGPLHKVAAAAEKVSEGAATGIGGTIKFIFGAPGRMFGRLLRGAQNVLTGLWSGKKYHKGGAEERQEEEAAAREAGARGAH